MKFVPLQTEPLLEPVRLSTAAGYSNRCLPTGIASLDHSLGGGLQRGQLTEIVGAPSSGRTSLLFSILAQATTRGEIVAYVDALDSLDPDFAEKSGIDLQRLLWIRCGVSSRAHLFKKAVKATDILARAGGFGVLALDLGTPKRTAKKIPFHCWFRLRRAIEGTLTVLLVLEEEATVGSASSVVVSLRRYKTQWSPTRASSQASRKKSGRRHLFRGIGIEAQLLRGKNHGQATFHCHLQP